MIFLIQTRYSCRSFYALGTFNSIKIPDRADEALLDSAVRRVREIERKMSVFFKDSEIARLNRLAGKSSVPLSDDTFLVLKHAAEISKASEGAFDITLGPLINLWRRAGKENRIPCEEEREACKKLSGYEDVLFKGSNLVALRRIGQAVDLGGIAKGYAADEVRKLLVSQGVESALINLGGNVVTIGLRPDKSLWKVGLQNPNSLRGALFCYLEAEDKTVVTSGGYERFFMKDGVRYHHILDPKTGTSVQSGLLSVTAVCKSSMDADALTTAFFVLGPKRGIPLFERFGASAVYVTEGEEIYASVDLAGTLKGS